MQALKRAVEMEPERYDALLRGKSENAEGIGSHGCAPDRIPGRAFVRAVPAPTAGMAYEALQAGEPLMKAIDWRTAGAHTAFPATAMPIA